MSHCLSCHSDKVIEPPRRQTQLKTPNRLWNRNFNILDFINDLCEHSGFVVARSLKAIKYVEQKLLRF